jgi:hypothetical protein
MKLLSEPEFLAIASGPMRRLGLEATPPFDFWDYFRSVPVSDFEEHDCSAGAVAYVWEDSSGRYQFVNVNCEDKNVFMVLVLDLAARTVLGHRLLDLNREYGLEPS